MYGKTGPEMLAIFVNMLHMERDTPNNQEFGEKIRKLIKEQKK